VTGRVDGKVCVVTGAGSGIGTGSVILADGGMTAQ
jgi:NADP-dependent 3-hydroxy acid dehydrogenase YdfG